MAEFASLAIDGAEKLWNPISSAYDYFKHYQKNVDALVEKAGRLKVRRDDVEAIVRAAESRDEEIRKEVREWQERADKLLKEHEALKDRSEKNKRCSGSGCLPDCRWRWRLSKEAVDMASVVDDILKEQRFDNVALPRAERPPEFRRTESMRKFMLFSSTEKAMDEVMEALRSGGTRVIGVHGMGGVGKTSMVKQVATKAISERLFSIVVMATVSQNPDRRTIRNKIADELGLESLGACSDEAASTKIRNRILREKKVLIILDDLWTKLDLDSVGIPYGSELEDCKSRIIITTRLQQVCTLMESIRIQLQHLSEPDSWEFFKRTAGTNFEARKFEEIGKLVAKECGGLPIALIAVAKALADKDIEEWKTAARLLQRSMPFNQDEDEATVKCIKLSYDFLKGKEKACFLICCLFPEDHNVGMEELARFGIGLDLFKEADTIEEARKEADLITKKLIGSGLLLDGDKKEQVKMHDVVRDVAIRIKSADRDGGEEPFFLVHTGRMQKEWPTRRTYKRYGAISLMCSEINRLPDVLDCTKLQTLMLQENSSLKEIPSTFFKWMNDLLILNLNGIQASSLPSSIESLKNLRTLHLDRCKFNDIAILGVLETLEILSLRESLIEALPEDMGKLRNLRLLDLTLCFNIQKIPSKLISSLYSLEELYLKGSFWRWEDAMQPGTATTHQGRNVFFDELVNLRRLRILKVDMENEKCLPRNIETVPNWEKFDICICREQFTRMMNVNLSKKASHVYSTNLLVDIQMKKLPNWFIEVVAKKAEKLIYSDCEDLNMLEEYKHGQFSGLESLVVEQCQEVCNLMCVTNNGSPGDSAPVFESLQELRIFHMDFLEKICVGELPTGSFERLKYLEVQQCNGLINSLLPPNLITRLGNLEKLILNVNSVEEVFGFEGLEQGQGYLGRLQEIRLENLYELANVYRGPERFADFRNLKFLMVIRCKKLRNLFSVSIPGSLVQLEDLWVEECDLMEEVIRSELEITLEVVIPRLKTLFLKNLPMLSSFYTGNASLKCPSLEHLCVQECQNFRTLASDFHSLNHVHENDEHHMKLLKKRLVGEREY
ncbi:disease resistance protein At4g27190 [Morus notabilis]|uniref:disease resistance protein At4g27190 n=1 Tax=Morus notabilis TaxID=981085 RepID=UPI000CED5EA9|nr:disease resistance protein At4g27190 [Morus notabilis]